MYDVLNQVRCWDYNKKILNLGNINGFECLRSVIVFGVFSIVLIYIFVPLILKLVDSILKKYFVFIFILILRIFVLDELYNLIFTKIFDFTKVSTYYKRLGMKYLYFYK